MKKWERFSSNKFFIVLAALLLLVGSVLVTAFLLKQSNNTKDTATRKSETLSEEKFSAKPSLTIAMMGDMLAHDSVVAQARTPDGYDFSPYFKNIKPLHTDADVVFCNAETPVAGDTLGVSGYPTFNAPSAFARDLADAGCNVINLASNHIADKGQAGIDASIAIWREQKNVLAVSGANSSAEEQRKVQYFTVKDVKIAFLAFADFSNSPLPHNYSLNTYHDRTLVDELLAEAARQAEFVIVSLHWGDEGAVSPNSDQRSTAQYFADRGASLIVGTGPHVLQPFETITSQPIDGSVSRDVPVWFSLGNMLSSQLQLNELTGGVASQVFIKQKGTLTATSTEFMPTFMSYDWPTEDRAAERLATRSNLQLRPLKDVGTSVSGMFPQASEDERQAFVKATLGDRVTVRQ